MEQPNDNYNNNNTDLLFLDDWQKTLLQPLNLVDNSPHNKTFSKQYSLVFIRDHSSTTNNAASSDDFSVFPPSNHENLTPSHFNHHPKLHPPPSPSHFDHNDDDSPYPPPPPVTLFPKWWTFALQILRSRISNIGTFFGCNSEKMLSFWSFKNVALMGTVFFWWLCLRVRRQRRKRESAEHLMQIIDEKDKKIMQLLDQIAQMNKVLLTRHKLLVSKTPD